MERERRVAGQLLPRAHQRLVAGQGDAPVGILDIGAIDAGAGEELGAIGPFRDGELDQRTDETRRHRRFAGRASSDLCRCRHQTAHAGKIVQRRAKGKRQLPPGRRRVAPAIMLLTPGIMAMTEAADRLAP